MIRVGFVSVFAVREWLGGLNYLRNLLNALADLEQRRIEPILFTSTDADPAISGEFAFMPVLRTRILDRGHPLWLVRKGLQRAFGSDPLLQHVLKSNGISLLSHSGDLGRGARIPCIGWVPDLQHRYLRQLYGKERAAARDANIVSALERCTRVIVSSETAARDLRTLGPQHAGKVRVLRFVSGLLHGGALPSGEELRATYRIDGPYMHLPNQFWAHKNHEVVIEALRRLKDSGRAATVVCTGLMRDPRQPQHAANLMKRVSEYALDKQFRPLGVVPYAHMLGLMRDAAAVLNPSLFEGWSTSVEEARSMGKAIVLSDIPVHREQAPDRGIYFDPHESEDAARAIWEAWSAFDAEADEVFISRAARELPRRMRQFAENYQDIVLEALQASGA